VPPDAVGLSALRGSPSVTVRDNASLAGGEAAASAANLRRIAELLGKDADERSDQYLRSIARTLERLSSDIEHTAIDRQVLVSKLENLVAHARRAYGEGSNAVPRAVPRDVVQQLEAALGGIADSRGVPLENQPPSAGESQARMDTAPQERARRPVQSSERKTPGAQASMTSPQDPGATDAALKDLDDYDLVGPR